MALSTADITVCTLYIIASIGIGLWPDMVKCYQQRKAGGTGGKAASDGGAADSAAGEVDEYLLASRSMGCFAVGISLCASLTSGITMLGGPGYSYENGLAIMFNQVSFLVATPVTAFVFLPFFNGLGVSTAYEYLELRFSLNVRLISSFLFIVRVMLYLATAMYAPALALDAVAGVPSWLTIVVTGVASGLYTAAGGLRAVIYTDVMQFFVLLGGVVIVLVVATAQVGGVGEVVRVAREGGRLTFFEPRVDLSDDYSTWNLMLGGIPYNLVQLATDQISVQRYLSAKSIESARRSLWFKLVLTTGITILSYLCGTVLFAFYNSGGREDPVAANETVADQVLPFFAVNELPASVPGIIVAAIFAATMSTTSSGLNAIATAVASDFGQSLNWLSSSEEILRCSRWVTVLATVLMIGASLAIAQLGDALIETSQVMNGIAGGPLLGIFLLGICTRRASAGGALCGGVIGAVAMGAISAAKYSCRPPTDGGGGSGGGSGCPEWLEVVGSLSVFLYATFGTAITLAVGYSASLLVWPNTAEERAALTGLCYGDHMMNDGGKYEAQQEERGRRKQAQAGAKGQEEGEGEGLRASLLGAGEGGGQQQGRS